MDKVQTGSDRTEGQRAAWRALWLRLLSPKREEPLPHRYDSNDPTSIERKRGPKPKGGAAG